MDTKKIGRFIAENRKAKNLTQKELAEKLGVSDKTVSRWENGNYMPDLSMLKPLSDVLDISLNELLSGEYITQENVAEKAEASIESTLEYSRRKIEKSRIKAYLMMVGCIYGLLFVWFLLNAVFFAEVPYQSGDVSQWEEQYPNHSAFEMGLSRTGQPVFVDTAKAMRQAKVIYSDAIDYLQKEYHLLPLSQYTYKPYMVYGWQIVCGDEAIKEQGRDLTGFLDIYDNCFEWKKLAMTQIGRIRAEGDRFSMWEWFQIAFGLMVLPGVVGVLAFFMGIYDFFQSRKLGRLKGRTEGMIQGLVKSHLFRNETHGDVPGGVLIGWGVSQGEQFWGGLLKKRVLPWFPCVKYSVDGQEICRIMGEGVWKDTWKIGQEVTVLYDPDNLRISTIEGDTSLQKQSKRYTITGLVLILISAVAIALFFC